MTRRDTGYPALTIPLLSPPRRGRPRRPHALRWLALAALLSLLGPLVSAKAARTSASTITLTPSRPSGQLVGVPITWTASAPGLPQPVYRFSVGRSGQPLSLLRDFSPQDSVVWTPLQEGTYTVQVTAQPGYTATLNATASATFTVLSRVPPGSTTPVISRTANPLVALFSAPPCAAGRLFVAFRAVGSTAWSETSSVPCVPGLSRNVYVAGMRARTRYELLDSVISGTVVQRSAVLTVTTGAPPASVVFPAISVPLPPTAQSDLAENMLWIGLEEIAPSNVPHALATDLQGRVLWYYSPPAGLHAVKVPNLLPGGRLLVQAKDSQGNGALREIDLAGNPLRETNEAWVNAQLAALGQERIYGFHHDALFLPNGDTAVLAYTLKYILLDGTSTPYMGDMLIVLDHNWQVTWTWDAFNFPNQPSELPTSHLPPLGETCGSTGGCPVPAPNAIDWLHTNTIDYTPADGNIVLSMRNQDLVVKIAYQNGAGDGHIIWRLGPPSEGLNDFTWVPKNSTDPFPWFSHQHDAHYVDDGRTLALFDDANTRCTDSNGNYIQGCDSRGQALVLNEQTRVVTQTVNVDLGNYSPALGSAERESNGNYAFTSGLQTPSPPGPPFGQSIEVLPDGTKVYVQQVQTGEYRAFRVADLYHGTNPPCPSCPAPQ